jgi:F420-dependent oxidoreductase-like protein
MDLRIMTEPQNGASYDDQLAVARAAEEAGFDAFFRSDHFLTMGGDGLPGPTDSWVTLGALARETSRIRLGTLVSSATFRLPGPLAVAVAQVDAMSGGRVELGLGTGWFEAEHTAYGVPFPPTGERFDRLEEQLEIVTGLWGTPVGERFSYSGKHYTLTDSPGLPKPVQRPVPIVVGGSGPKRTPRLAARFAAEFNCIFVSPAEARQRWQRVADACAEIGRERPPTWSIMLPFAVGRDDAEVRRRAEARGARVDDLRRAGVAGTPAAAVDALGRYAEAGAQRVYLQLLDLADLDQIELIGSEVRPRLS